MRADRLLSILLLLQNRGKMTSRELAQILEISERTVFRDMEALSASGIPILAERGREGGWMLTEGYRTSLTGMKPQEIGSLLLSTDASILKDLGIQDDFSSAILKLEAASSHRTSNPAHHLSERIHIDGASWHPSDETYPFLSVLQGALWEDRKVKITYLRSNETTVRFIDPLGLVAKRGVWYVVAKSEDELRTFRVSRLVNVEETHEGFKRPDDFDLKQYWEESTMAFKAALPKYQVKLRVRTSVLKELQRERFVSVQLIEPTSNAEWVNVDAEFNTIESACRIILSFSPSVIVLSPQELLEMVKSAITKISAIYEDF
ncbi:YafY family protein [Paenibacillus sp. FSL K6-3166]|uniref:helix-turn-helix transcriptional regulator n=1 Tax=unclassified Paenibacillus TaxID=185978 RepID=UPI000BA0DBB2|nr:YafY family protein [Paenibacillus sp. VTT E-133291]OZQ94084.1 transcriptional regulator [Paenibacillus sp. VTT E-133291]